MKPYKCPVCNGWGMLNPEYLYDIDSSGSMMSNLPIQCPACKGTGIVWEKESRDGHA